MANRGKWWGNTDCSVYEWFDNYQGEKVNQHISLELCSTNCDRGRFKSSFVCFSPLGRLNLDTYYFDRQRAMQEIESWATFISESINLELKQKRTFEKDIESNTNLTTLISSECLRLETKLPGGVIESHLQEIYSFDVELHSQVLEFEIADLFPRYYFDKSVAKLEMIEWSKRWLRNYTRIFTEYANINRAKLIQEV